MLMATGTHDDQRYSPPLPGSLVGLIGRVPHERMIVGAFSMSGPKEAGVRFA